MFILRMQEEVLKLVLLALEDGSALSRKILVMFVVQKWVHFILFFFHFRQIVLSFFFLNRLEPQFPQASKTSIGHVVQLLYRASCFKVCSNKGEGVKRMQNGVNVIFSYFFVKSGDKKRRRFVLDAIERRISFVRYSTT